MKRDEFIKWVNQKTNFKSEGVKNIFWRYDIDYIDYIDVADNIVIYGWNENSSSKKYLFKFQDFIKAYELRCYHKNRINKIDLNH